MKGLVLGLRKSPEGVRTFWTGAFVDEEILVTDAEVCIVDEEGRVKDSVPRTELVHLLIVEGDHYKLKALR